MKSPIDAWRVRRIEAALRQLDGSAVHGELVVENGLSHLALTGEHGTVLLLPHSPDGWFRRQPKPLLPLAAQHPADAYYEACLSARPEQGTPP